MFNCYFMHTTTYLGSPAPKGCNRTTKTRRKALVQLISRARDSSKSVRWPSSGARLKAWVSFAYAHGEL